MTVSENSLTKVPAVEDPIFQMQDVSVTFDMDRGQSRVLDNISFNIQRQEILGIIGESGSGKSMFASALLNSVVDPGKTSGKIIYNSPSRGSVDILSLTEKEIREIRWKEISMVFQGAMSSFNPVRTIKAHFRETIKAHSANIDERMDHARELLSDLYLDPERVLNSYPHELSGGMSQRALIALSLVLEPNVLVMDEPTAALDLLMQRSILNLLADLQEKYNLTVVFITHDLPLVADLADRLGVMYAFDLVECGPSEEIIEFPTHPYTRALLKSVPNLDAPLDDMKSIGGSAPDPVNVPTGCSYASRCPLADKICRETDPLLFEVNEGHRSACHYWREATNEISLISNPDNSEKIPTSTGAQSSSPVISLSDVEIHFEKEKSGLLGFFQDSEIVRAVDDVNLDIYENDVVALVGESGCGKTTLGKAAIGVQSQTKGDILYRGQSIEEAEKGNGTIEYEKIRRALQIIHQDPGSALNPNKKVISSLSKPLKRWYPELNKEDRHERILGMLETVGMEPPEDYADRYPHQLSGGEKQRVVLVRALLMNPDLILADEAISALDVSLRVEMMDLMLDLQEEFNTSFLFISHDLSNARYFAGKADGRIGVMYLGQLVEIGPAEEIINNPKHPYTKVLKWSTADLEKDQEVTETPLRTIDIPDPTNPPSGCRFHTRCPDAREVCKNEDPALSTDDDKMHSTVCFRVQGDDHAYWESEPLDSTN